MNIDAAWNFSKPDESEQRFRSMLGEAHDEATRVEVKTQLARSLGLQRKFEDAHSLLDEVEPMLDDTMQRIRVRYLLERGRTYNSSNVKDKARTHFLEAYNLSKSLGEDNLTIDAAHMMGIVESGDESLRWNEIAIADAEVSQDERARNWLGALLNNTGWTYFDLSNFQRALELFEKSLAWRVEMKHEEPTRIAKWTIARAHRALGRVEEALAEQRALQQEYNNAKADEQGYVSEELGECLLLLGRTDESKPHFAMAYEKLSANDWMKADEPQRLERLKTLSA